MDKMLYMIVFSSLVIANLVQDTAAQTVHVVGDNMGWIVPSNGEVAYTNWAAGKTFRVGDTLVFNFTTGRHDVLQVEETSFDGCNSQNAIGTAIMTGPANITINSTDDHYFICTFGTHCLGGQKLEISVSDDSTSTPGTNPSVDGPTGSVPGGVVPPPPPSSSTTTVLASFVLSLSAIALAIFH
ncbi:hypothetical protein KY290_018904 [Solanum tuberosum]|uniref:Phytocyanin domain-containing protein n=1 Tax=Solanum tuberosum TaxID=4113 RepID=A0ABQ7VHD5_SOLTU|nr:hypothetical protein KY290_018904 [Solanum tuberosum]